jgi:flagellin-like hook-associated protein FlgL
MSMRITDSYMASLLLGDLNRSLGNMLEQQRMAGSMRRLNSFADDPRAVGTVQRYNALIANNDDYLSNVSRSRIIIDSTDSALQNISEVLSEARVIALRESSALATRQSRNTAMVEVDNLVNRLMDVLNTTVEGNYIFSGRQTSTPPFVNSGGTVLYQGDTGEISSRTGPDSTTTVNIPGNLFVGSQSASLGGRADMGPRLRSGTLLSDLNLGEGWERGSISVRDGDGNMWEIDLSASATVGDVLAAVSAGTGGAVTADISGDGSALTFSGTGPLFIGEAGGGDTAASLGINAQSDGSLLTGRDVRAGADDATLLADIAALDGKLPLGTMNVAWQGNTYAVDLSGAVTLGDLTTVFNATVPGMEMVIKDSSLQLVGGSPETFQITNGDATNTASALGLAGEGGPVRLFGMLEDLRASLDAGDADAIRGAVNELSSIEDMVYQLMMKNGGRQNDLDWAEGILHQRDERLRSNLSLEIDVDVAKVAADLSRAETTYQASLLVSSKLYQTNLMQYLR